MPYVQQLRSVNVAAAAVAVFLVSALIMGLTMAAFTADADTGGSWSAGTVEITHDQGGELAFEAENIAPGYEESQTITVTDESSVDTTVAMAATASGELAEHLLVTVERGGTSIVNGVSLNDLPGALETDGDSWDATGGTDESRDYTITVTLPEATTEGAGQSAEATFIWVAESR